MCLRRTVSWSTAMRDLRRERTPHPRTRAPVEGTPALLTLEGRFCRSAIMQRASALARRHRLSQPDQPRSRLMAGALRVVWSDARLMRFTRLDQAQARKAVLTP